MGIDSPFKAISSDVEQSYFLNEQKNNTATFFVQDLREASEKENRQSLSYLAVVARRSRTTCHVELDDLMDGIEELGEDVKVRRREHTAAVGAQDWRDLAQARTV